MKAVRWSERRGGPIEKKPPELTVLRFIPCESLEDIAKQRDLRCVGRRPQQRCRHCFLYTIVSDHESSGLRNWASFSAGATDEFLWSEYQLRGTAELHGN